MLLLNIMILNLIHIVQSYHYAHIVWFFVINFILYLVKLSAGKIFFAKYSPFLPPRRKATFYLFNSKRLSANSYRICKTMLEIKRLGIYIPLPLNLSFSLVRSGPKFMNNCGLFIWAAISLRKKTLSKTQWIGTWIHFV